MFKASQAPSGHKIIHKVQLLVLCRASQAALVVKNQTGKAGDVREAGAVPGLGRSPGGGHGNPVHHSGLENAMDRGAWWVTAHRLTESNTTTAT